ncbi:peptidase [Plantactinospora sp. BC1]|uniref:serine hydrolase domain-containing protein n=1 Tax=Plantactinospora sp. BC1 TaxID=2108470 RepID=UPI000D15E23F|nr:serine hydrolase domain-containing protein [Plantactinospora sp. BC1]AVT33320.1 peptidase [Plantactinospora sp. BC1]
MKISKGRTRAVALVAAAALGAAPLASPASAAGPAATRHRPAACPAGHLETAALEQAMAGLPDEAVATSAQVRVTTPDGCWTGATGVARLRTEAPVPRNARFRIGSVTKVFTATVVLKLAAEGRIDLGAPVQRYLPGLLPADYPTVTVRQLLDHTSGLPSPTLPDDIEWALAHRYDRWTPEQLVRLGLRNERAFDPGKKQQYTNMGYIVAGMLIEKVTGHSYAREMRRQIFQPLGLHDTYVPGDDPTIRGPHAHGYQSVTRNGTGTLVDVTNWNQSITPAAGDLISTLADLDTFAEALFGGRLLPAAQLAEMFTLPAVDDVDGGPALYSVGLTAFRLPTGETLWVKSGSRYGYSAALAGTRDGSFRVAYSVTSTDAKGDGQNPVTGAIVQAVLGMR